MRFSVAHTNELSAVADKHGLTLAHLLAVVEVESNGVLFARIANENMPVIRWEGHYFDRLLPVPLRQKARDAGLAHPSAGHVKNPSGQDKRYVMLSKAINIHMVAAYSSISIGVGQVMGSHATRLGFSSPQAMFARASQGLTGQVEIMMAYIVEFGLLDELLRQDWAGFARGYNGPGYAKNKYHTRMEAAFKRHGGVVKVSPASGMLRMGSVGARVRELQTLLSRAGYALKVDGDFGTATRDAVRAFQRDNGLAVDGVAGPQTMSALTAFRTDPEEAIGAVAPTDTPEAKTGIVGIGGGVGLGAAADKLTAIADRLAGEGSLAYVEHISTGLYVLAGALVLAGIIHTARGFYRAKGTYEGTS